MKIKNTKCKFVVCDNCEKSFVLKSKDIKVKKVNIDDEVLSLVYFECKHCKEIFRICLHDDEYDDLRKRVEVSRNNLKDCTRFDNVDVFSMRLSLLEKDIEKLTNYIKSFENKYPGKFVYDLHGDKKIIYVKEN